MNMSGIEVNDDSPGKKSVQKKDQLEEKNIYQFIQVFPVKTKAF